MLFAAEFYAVTVASMDHHGMWPDGNYHSVF